MLINKSNLNYQIRLKEDFENISFGEHRNQDLAEKKRESIVNIVTVASTVLSVLVTVGIISKNQKVNLFKKPNFLNWNKPSKWQFSKIKFEEKEILSIAGASILGGILGGVLSDKKENAKSKIREGVFQMVGNILIPIGFVSSGIKILDKWILPKTKLSKKTGQIIQGISTLFTLTFGALFGNFVGNFINKKIFGYDKQRQIKVSDLSAHLDDICLALTLITQGKGGLGSFVSRFIPFALLIPGIKTGTNIKDSQ